MILIDFFCMRFLLKQSCWLGLEEEMEMKDSLSRQKKNALDKKKLLRVFLSFSCFLQTFTHNSKAPTNIRIIQEKYLTFSPQFSFFIYGVLHNRIGIFRLLFECFYNKWSESERKRRRRNNEGICIRGIDFHSFYHFDIHYVLFKELNWWNGSNEASFLRYFSILFRFSSLYIMSISYPSCFKCIYHKDVVREGFSWWKRRIFILNFLLLYMYVKH